MYALFTKEIKSFFGSLIGYVIIGVFLVANGLFLWVLPSSDNANIIESGLATLEPLFVMAPWLYLLLIPAMTMRSMADEKMLGTLELIVTKPISDLQIILAKYFANLTILILSLLPTLIYFYTIYKYGAIEGNIDTGATWGSYIGLFLLGAIFIAIGIFSSAITKSQIISLIIAIILCIFCYIGFEYVSEFFGDDALFIDQLGISHHYYAISQGQIDSRDVVYYLSTIVFFILLTQLTLSKRKW
ncbi:MAG: gliding motility-associated ABC transporter permease subunit GldF [Flavobacteriales bacterium]